MKDHRTKEQVGDVNRVLDGDIDGFIKAFLMKRANGTLGDLQPFAERGGESVVADSAGNVYIANGQVFVHDASGKLTGRIDVPERPVQLLFGGADRRTLFILTHRALYSATTRVPGEATPWGK